jgi:glutaminyl-tRNA synthetase
MAVLRPLKVVIENYPADQVEELEALNHPQDPSMGARRVPFCRELYIDRNDFMEQATGKFKRLVAGGEVRLRYGYVIRCNQLIKDGGEVIELRCSYDPATLGADPAGRKVKGVIHWVSARHGLTAEVRLYDRLFTHPLPDAAREEGKEFTDFLNPDSLHTLTRCVVEPSMAEAQPGDAFQFEREGYFCLDPARIRGAQPVFNRTVTLREAKDAPVPAGSLKLTSYKPAHTRGDGSSAE